MAESVTEHFGIPKGPVEFVDVDVFDDNLLFVDPSAIRWGAKDGDPWCQAAHGTLCRFFDELLARIADPSRGSGREMCKHFHEPRETRLGMSEVGSDGSCADDELGNRIWEAMGTNPLCTLAVPIFRRVEHLALFVDDIADDRVSDITTRIIFRNLVDFTREQMVKHPELGPGETFTFDDIWDEGTAKWGKAQFTLPCVHGGLKPHAPLLLVPNRATYYRVRMLARHFRDIAVLDAVRETEMWVDGDGKVHRPTKKSLKARDALADVRPTNQAWTERMLEEDRNLLAVYESYVDGRFEPLDYWATKARL